MLFGLGLANHHTIVLCLPLVIWALVAACRRGARTATASMLAAAAGLVLGLLPYGYVLAASARAQPGQWSWGAGAINGLPALLGHFLRREYGTFRLSLHDFDRDPWGQIGANLGGLVDGFFYLFFALGLWGAMRLYRRQRGFALALAASFLLAAVLFPAAFNLPASPLARAVAERFHLLGYLLFVPALGVGIDQAGRRLSRAIAAPALALVLLLATGRGLGAANWRGDDTVERYLGASLASAAPQAVIFGEGDIGVCGFRYLSQARGIRPDVRYIDVHLVRQRWYHDLVQREVPQLAGLAFNPQSTPLRAMIAQLAPTTPTYLTMDLAGKLADLHPFPEGFLLRVASPRPPPAPEALEPLVEQALARLLPLPAPIDPWVVHVRGLAAQPLLMLASAYDQRGDRTRAQRCRSRAAVLTSDAALPVMTPPPAP